MTFQFDIAWLLSVMLISIRVAVLMFATPLDAFGRVPARIKVLFGFSLAVLLVSLLNITVALPANVIELGLLGLYELCIGFVMVLGIYMAFGAFMLAGNIMDFQMGFSAAAIFDPSTNSQTPLTAVLLSLLALVLFFTLDGHHLMLRGIIYSLETLPPGAGALALNAEAVIQQFGLMFVYGLVLAAPVLAGLMLLDVGLGVMARTMPQMNVYFVMLPLKIFVGLFLLALTMNYLLPLVKTIFMSIFKYWQQVLVV